MSSNYNRFCCDYRCTEDVYVSLYFPKRYYFRSPARYIWKLNETLNAQVNVLNNRDLSLKRTWFVFRTKYNLIAKLFNKEYIFCQSSPSLYAFAFTIFSAATSLLQCERIYEKENAIVYYNFPRYYFTSSIKATNLKKKKSSMVFLYVIINV